LVEWSLILVTAYCDFGFTYSGEMVRPGIAACPPGHDGLMYVLPYTNVGWECIDRGSMVNDGHIDIWMPDCEKALLWGRKWIALEIRDERDSCLGEYKSQWPQTWQVGGPGF
jgi:hypothetical protein